MKNCEYYEELIGAALDGEITAEEDKELRAHLESCEACRKLLPEGPAEAGQEPAAEESSAAERGVLQGISREWKRQKRRSWRRGILLGMALLLALALLWNAAAAAEAVRRLKALPGVEVFTPANGPHPTGVVSFRAAGRDCEELAEALGRRGIALRAGLHCAPLAHRTAGTLDTGTVRLSLSDFNTPAQIEKLAQELHQLFRETVR